jgi:hypothetical protein
MHFPDLSAYVYHGSEPDGRVLNVGWLGRDHAFSTGETSSAFVEALRQLVALPVKLFRGYHKCEFCPDSPPRVVGGFHWNTDPPEVLGNGEIRVVANGVTYVAPVLVRHYVEVHRYKPPQAFVDACLAAIEGRATPNNRRGLTRKEFGRALSEELDRGYDPVRLAKWACRIYWDAKGLDAGLEDEILTLVNMVQGSEFEMSEGELRTMAKRLQES